MLHLRQCCIRCVTAGQAVPLLQGLCVFAALVQMVCLMVRVACRPWLSQECSSVWRPPPLHMLSHPSLPHPRRSYLQNNSLTGGLPLQWGGPQGMARMRFFFAANNPLGGAVQWAWLGAAICELAAAFLWRCQFTCQSVGCQQPAGWVWLAVVACLIMLSTSCTQPTRRSHQTLARPACCSQAPCRPPGAWKVPSQRSRRCEFKLLALCIERSAASLLQLACRPLVGLTAALP